MVPVNEEEDYPHRQYRDQKDPTPTLTGYY